MNETAYALYESADKLGLLFVLKAFGTDIQVRVPLSNNFCNQSIDMLNLSVRSCNGLKRYGATTIGDVFDIIMSEAGLAKIRNLGRKSISEIKTSMLVFGYDELNDREKLDFWHHFVRMNGLPDTVTLGGVVNA